MNANSTSIFDLSLCEANPGYKMKINIMLFYASRAYPNAMHEIKTMHNGKIKPSILSCRKAGNIPSSTAALDGLNC